MHKLALVAGLTLLASPAFAGSELDRLELATVTAGENLEAFLVSRAPVFGTYMPEWMFSDELRAAETCTLAEIRTRGGDVAVEQYLTSFEAFAALDISTMQQVADAMPVPIDPDVSVQIAQICGTDDIALLRIAERGFVEAMSNPNVIMALAN